MGERNKGTERESTFVMYYLLSSIVVTYCIGQLDGPNPISLTATIIISYSVLGENPLKTDGELFR